MVQHVFEALTLEIMVFSFFVHCNALTCDFQMSRTLFFDDRMSRICAASYLVALKELVVKIKFSVGDSVTRIQSA